MKEHSGLYGTSDPRNIPIYGTTEAARIIRSVPASTLHGWFNGEQRVLDPTNTNPITLSFNDVIEASVLKALRVTRQIELKSVRRAIEHIRSELEVERPLLRRDLLMDGVGIIAKYYCQHIQSTPSQKLLIQTLIKDHCERIEWDSNNLAKSIHPAITGHGRSRYVCVDPLVFFGQATVSGKKISTSIIYDRFNDGDSIDELKADYDLTGAEIRSAIMYQVEI